MMYLSLVDRIQDTEASLSFPSSHILFSILSSCLEVTGNVLQKLRLLEALSSHRLGTGWGFSRT